jgi:hypothetical protein
MYIDEEEIETDFVHGKPYSRPTARVARWFILKRKISIWVNFWSA